MHLGLRLPIPVRSLLLAGGLGLDMASWPQCAFVVAGADYAPLRIRASSEAGVADLAVLWNNCFVDSAHRGRADTL